MNNKNVNALNLVAALCGGVAVVAMLGIIAVISVSNKKKLLAKEI